MRVRQPGVHREHRYLHRERGEEREEDPELLGVGQRQRVEIGDVVAARLQVQIDERDEHEHRPEEGVEEELDRRVHAARTAPDPDDEEHRDQHCFPEEVEEERIERREDADHQPFQDQERREKLGLALLDDRPCRDQHRHGDEGGEQHQRQRDAIDAEMIGGVERRDPLQPFDRLERRGAGIESRPERHR